MGFFEGLLGLLDSRSFATIWFWIMLATIWSWMGRNVLGVPPDLFRRASAENGEGVVLLDWLSLILPRWRVGQREGAWLTGIGAFVLSALLILGFGYGLEMAQALFLLLGPLALVQLLNFRLARRLRAVLAAAQKGSADPAQASLEAAKRMRFHRHIVTFVSVLTVVIAALWGALWIVMHPFGI